MARLTNEEKFRRFRVTLEEQDNCTDEKELTSKTGYTRFNDLKKLMEKQGYYWDDGVKKFVLIDGNTSSNTTSDTDSITESNTDGNTENNSIDEEAVVEAVEGNTDSNTCCDAESITDSDTMSNTPISIDNTSISTLEPTENTIIKGLIDEHETLHEMLRWFKTYKTNTTINTDIVIELPKSENAMVTCRSNKAVWERFGAFAEKNKDVFPKGDLLAQALQEFMDKFE